ncbi:ionotropic receptor 25a [Aplysia californica]|uniref:Ionotropic receptor 25a n=1 Tax=Aplysia californica TaxID=6500 RepID=A0ABM1A3W3_APLCA|nr:ionotropic receptor 25a [Aplysia californica]
MKAPRPQPESTPRRNYYMQTFLQRLGKLTIMAPNINTFTSIVFLVVVLTLVKIGAFLTQPTVVVVIDQDIDLYYNQNLKHIFENMHKFADRDKKKQEVVFTVVEARNDTDVLDEVCALLHSGAVALIDMSTPSLSPLLRSTCSSMGLTYISVVDRSYFNHPIESKGTELMIEPPASQMLKVVADIAKKEQLNNIAIIYDETFDIQNTPRRVLTNVPAQHLYIRLSRDLFEIRRNMETLVKINIKIIFIIASRYNAQHFLGEMTKNKIQNFDPNIFILTKAPQDAKVLCEACAGTERIVQITAGTSLSARGQFIDYMRRSRIVRDFDMERIKVDEALAFDIGRIVTLALEAVPNVQNIVKVSCDNGTDPTPASLKQSAELTNELTVVSIPGVLGPLSWSEQSQALRYNMTLLLSEMFFESGILKSKDQVANWTQAGGLQLDVPTLQKANKKKRYRIVTVAGIPPFVYKEEPINSTGPPVYKGYCIDLLERIAQDMNFDYEIHDVEIVGSMDDDGNWSGVIKELIDNKADIAVGPISVMAERENVIDFTVPYYDLVGLTILMRKPRFDYSLVKFLNVLDEEVWGCIIGAFFLFSILICVFDKLSPFSYQNRKNQWKSSGSEPRVFTLKEGVWFCMMSLTPQGGGETPKALSGRLIAATWWLFGFIIIATYTANLAAFLTVSRLETPIESLDDLSEQFKVQYAPMNGSTAMIYFKRMAHIEHRFYEIWKNMSLNDNLAAVERAQLAVWDYPVSDKYTKLWQTMQDSHFPSNKTEAVHRVLNEDFAFISDATTNKYQTLINCDLWQVGEEFSRKPYALAVQEGSPLRSQLSNIILKLINQRALEEMKTKWWKEDEKECPKLENETDGISIRNIGGVFLVIVIGSGLSLITLAFECYWYRLRPERKTLSKMYNGRSKDTNSQGQLTTSGTATSVLASDSQMSKENQRNNKLETGGLDSGFVNTGFELNGGGLDSGFTSDRIIERTHTEWF